MKPLKVRISTLLLAVYIILSLIFFALVVDPSLTGKNDFRLSADSHAYILYSRYLLSEGRLLTISQNFLGPALILEALNYNNLLVVLFNFGLFFVSYLVLERNFRLNRVRFLVLLFINPLFFISLLAINKEILGVCSVLFLASYMASGKARYLLVALVLSFLTRWHMTAVILIFLVLFSPLSPLKRSRWLALALIVLAITVAFPIFLGNVFDIITPGIDLRQQETSFGLTRVMTWLQYHFGFFLIVIPKILFNYFGNLFRFFDIFVRPQTVDFKDIYNTYFLIAHQYLMLFVFLWLIKKKRFSTKSIIIFFCLLYSVIFSISLFIQYRYFFPVYILFCLELSLLPGERLFALFGNKYKIQQSYPTKQLKVFPVQTGLTSQSPD